MDKIKIAFLIHDLGQGGAEKVLVNLVNNMDSSRFDITLIALLKGGVNAQFLRPHIRYRVWIPYMIPGNSKLMKLVSPKTLYKLCVKEQYDIVVSYLEGPTARLVSGCPDENTKLVSWIHAELLEERFVTASFRSKKETEACYNRFDRMIYVSDRVRKSFETWLTLTIPGQVLYNTVESQVILKKSSEAVPGVFDERELNIIGVGSLKPVKAFDRLIRIHKRLRDAGLPTHLYLLGRGPDAEMLKQQAAALGVADTVTFLGYQTNPYRYVAKCDLFVCSSLSEGFSTAATEALIVGTPVCTVEVSGMKEMLGEQNEYGVITENDDEALYQGIFDLLTTPGKLEHYRTQAKLRGQSFSTTETVRAVEEMLTQL